MISEMLTPESQSESIKRRAQLVINACERYSKGGNRDPGIWFFRGTTVADLHQAVLAGYTYGQRHTVLHGVKGDIWAAPVETRINSPFVARYYDTDDWESVREAQATAIRYAERVAISQAMMDAAGIKKYDEHVNALMTEIYLHDENETTLDRMKYLREDPYRYFTDLIDGLIQEHGSIEALANLLDKAIATKPKGVVLGIHKKVLDNSSSIGIEDDGVRIGVGEKGLGLEDISTIYMPGPDGKEYLQQLKSLLR